MSVLQTRVKSLMFRRVAVLGWVSFFGVLFSWGQMSIDIRPDAVDNTPGTNSTFFIDYRWASTTQELAGAKIEIPLPDPIDNDAAADVVLGQTPHVQSALLSTATKKVTYTFKNPLPAGAAGTLSLQTRYRADGTITNGVVRQIQATFSATDKTPAIDTAQMISTNCLPAAVTLSKTRSLGGTTNELVRYTITAQVPQLLSLDVDPFILVDYLPTGAVFVAASASGVYNASTHTVTWPSRKLESGASAARYTLDVIYPASNGFVTGSSVTNIAVSTNSPLYSDIIIRAVTNTYTLVSPSLGITQQRKIDASFAPIFGDSFTWEVEFRHNGNAMADTATVEDSFPPEFYPTAFNPGYAFVNPTVVRMYYRTRDNPSPWVQVSDDPVTTISSTDANAKLVLVSSLGLSPGDVVTGFRWVYTNFSPVADCRVTGSIGPTTTGYIGQTDRNGQTVSPTALITNTATIVLARVGLSSVTNTVTDTVQLAQPRPNVDLTKALNPTGQVGYPGTTNTWRLTVQNTSAATTNLFNPVIADLLPAQLEYVSGSAVRGGGFTNAIVTATPNYRGTGRTLLTIAFQGSLGINTSTTLDFKTVVRGTALGGTVQNTFSFLGSDNTGTVFVDTAVSDTSDLDNDGNTTETFSTTSANLPIQTTAALNSRKAIQGYPDLSFQALESASYLGGPMAYRLRVQNIGNVAFTNVTIIDILPHLGDTGVIVTNELRGSQWTPFLTGPVSAPAGVSVYYSQSANPWRPELLAGGPPDAVNDWSPVPPDDIRTVKSLRFSFGNTVLAPADTFELTWPMQVPLDAPTNTYAVNSFGYVATRQDTGDALLPSEPLSVRIKANPPAPVNIGDYVWNDANTNGVQDVGETGLDNVRVELYRDGGDNVAGSADDVFVTFVLTGINTNGASGFYQFSNEPPGNYFVRVLQPVGYAFSPADQGVDDTADSDIAPASGYSTMLVTQSGDQIWTIDAGLYFTGYGTLGNYVWNDRNGDGIQNESPADGLNDVRVELHEVVGGVTNLLNTRTTAYDSFGNPGYYSFDYVSPGDYVLRYVAPSNFTFTTRGPTGTSDATDSDPDPETGFTERFTVTVGENDLAWDAGLLLPSGTLSLGNIVWYDSDGDRAYDRLSGENGINGVPLSLYRDVNGDGVITNGVDPLYGSTVTATLGGEEGRYLFSGLPAGNYIVTVDATAFASGKALHEMLSTPGQQTANNDIDHDDNGVLEGERVVSTIITLSAGGEPAYGTDSGEDASADSNLTLDFGFLYATNLVGVGGTLFLDADGNGLQGVGETTFDGEAVHLWSAGADGLRGGGDDVLLLSMLSDGEGRYLFDDLGFGRYYVAVPTPPATARSATTLADANDNAQDGDSNALQPGGIGTVVYSPVFELHPLSEPAGATETAPGGDVDDSLAKGDANVDLTQDLGFADYQPLWELHGQVRDDYNADGLLSAPDRSVGGVTVHLYTDPNGDGNPADGTLLLSTITLTNGVYAFTDLPNGRYVVVEVDPVGATSTADTFASNDNRVAVTINDANSLGNDFLDAVDPHGYFYHVLDGQIVPGGLVEVAGPGAVNVVMDGSTGQYRFLTDSTPGEYTLTVTPPAGYFIDPSRLPAGVVFDPSGGPDPTRLGAGESTNAPGYLADWSGNANPYYYTFYLASDAPIVLNNNFPLAKPCRLGDRVWEDRNANGVQDVGEPGFSNVVVRLMDENMNAVTSTVTDVNGYYIFDELAPNNWTVAVETPSGYINTLFKVVTTNDTADSDVCPACGDAWVTLVSGSTNLNLDAGFTRPAQIYGYAFLDINTNLVRTARVDYPIAGMTVTLWRAGIQIASTLTSADGKGRYEFANLTAGDYTIRFAGATNLLEAVPSSPPASTDPERNRATLDGADTIFIDVTVAPGEGVLTATEPRNAGFIRPERPLSESVSIRAYLTAEGVLVEFTTSGEEDYGWITLWVWLDGGWVELGSTPAVGVGSNTYSFDAPGLVAGQQYYFQVEDEVSNLYDLYGVAVTPFAMEMQLMDRTGVRLKWASIPGREYVIYKTTDLGGGWTFHDLIWAEEETTSLDVEIDPAKQQCFFKIEMLRDVVIEEGGVQ